MRTTICIALAPLAVLLLSCSGGAVSAADVAEDAGEDVTGDAADAVEDVQEPPEATGDEQPQPDLGPAGGDPCDDGNACTHSETLSEAGVCGGGVPYACNDGRECTDDQCDGKGSCKYTVKEGMCLVSGVCAADGESAPGDPCAKCEAAVSFKEWQQAADGVPCDDGNACTQDDTCNAGQCVATPVDCDDGNVCTSQTCDPESGCVVTDNDGIPCVEEDLCALDSVCSGGVCGHVKTLSCDDGNPCTQDDCAADSGCTHQPLDGLPCDDGDVCAGSDICVADVCTPGLELAFCDDGNECTDDFCHPASGCYHELNANVCCDDTGVNICDDGNFCTTDTCNPDTGECFNTPNDKMCSDGNPCTGPDVCSLGACVGAALDCNDGNPCTTDACDAKSGCVNAPIAAGPCDDGLECSTGDACVNGTCVADMSQCVCSPEFASPVNKLVTMSIGEDGHPGSGLDVDADPATCSPAGKCSQGVDNALSLLASFAGSQVQSALDKGTIILLLEHRGFSAAGDGYDLAFYIGKSADAGCNIQADVCPYLVKAASFDDQCQPQVVFGNAKMTGTTLSAGGKGTDFPFPLALSDGVVLDLVLFNAQVQAQVTFLAGAPDKLDGVLAGAVPKQTMIDAIAALPDGVLPVDKNLAIQMLELLVQADIDADGDGTKESASIGLPFTANAGVITGTTD